MELKDILQQHVDTVEEKLGELDLSVRTADERLRDIEQKMDRSLAGDRGPFVTNVGTRAGAIVAESERVRPLLKEAGNVRIEVKDIISSADASGAALGAPAYRDDVDPLPQRQLVVRNLLNVVRMTTGTAEYPRQTTRDNNAATVAEGALKPSSDYAWEMAQVPIRTIAHWVQASRQVLADAPQLQGIIDGELRFGLADIEDHQILNGTGTGTDLGGIYPQAAAFAAPFDPDGDVNEIDIIGLALLQADNTDMLADGITLHPTDWTRMRMLKDAQGRYILGDPQAAIQPALFGRPVVPTKGQAVGTFMVGPFKRGATLYDRQEAEVLVSTEDRDNFVRNLVTILGEERVGLAVKRPSSFIKGTFASIKAALNA